MEGSRLSWEADKQQIQKVKDDIALNVAVAYLQILLAKEQVNLAKVQVSQTVEQLSNTRKRVNAGALPELNAAELEAQLARDSSLTDHSRIICSAIFTADESLAQPGCRQSF